MLWQLFTSTSFLFLVATSHYVLNVPEGLAKEDFEAIPNQAISYIHPDSKQRDLSQVITEELSCECRRSERYNPEQLTWIIDDRALSDCNNDIQHFVNCADSGDTLLFSASYEIKPQDTVIIDKSLKISRLHKQFPVTLEIYPKTTSTVIFGCPESGDRGIFTIRSGEVLFANLEIRYCDQRNGSSPIVIESCDGNSRNRGIKFHHMAFANNGHKTQPAALNASTESLSCGILEIIDASFSMNRVSSGSSVALFRGETILKDIRIDSNLALNDEGSAHVLAFQPPVQADKKTLLLDNLVAKHNQIPGLSAQTGNVNISHSRFIKNHAHQPQETDRELVGSLLTFHREATVFIKNTSFEENLGPVKGMVVSDEAHLLHVQESIFRGNSKSDSIICIANSTLLIKNCTFQNNSGESNGGVFCLFRSTNATFTSSIFTENRSSRFGGAIYVSSNSTTTMNNCFLSNNTAREGGAIYMDETTLVIHNTNFTKNNASVDGGAIRLDTSSVTCERSWLEENHASDAGGAFYVENSFDIVFRNVVFANNTAGFGSAIRLVKSKYNIRTISCLFLGNHASLTGAAAYVDDSQISFDQSMFKNNTSLYGGALYAQAFNITLTNSEFANNTGNVMGGGISGDRGTATIHNVTFSENHSALGGAAHFYNAVINATEVSLFKNTASEGAGLLCKRCNIHISPSQSTNSAHLTFPTAPHQQEEPFESVFGLSAVGNNAESGGGAIQLEMSDMSLSYAFFHTNSGPEGGAIHITSEGMFVNISNSSFLSNTGRVNGGALYLRAIERGTSLELRSSNFSNCQAGLGGAIYTTSVNVLIDDCHFWKNTAFNGAAATFEKNIKVVSETSDNIRINVTKSTFISNRALVEGAGLLLRGAFEAAENSLEGNETATESGYEIDGFNVFLDDVTFEQNNATDHGGGISGYGTYLKLSNANMSYNYAKDGGAVFLKNCTVIINRSSVEHNTAQQDGGGIFAVGGSTGNIYSSNFTSNSAYDGHGGGLGLSAAVFVGENVHFRRNQALFGGATSARAFVDMAGNEKQRFTEDSKFSCRNCSFAKNAAYRSGGAIDIVTIDAGHAIIAQLLHCEFTRNKAPFFGGGLHFVAPFDKASSKTWRSYGRLIIVDTLFQHNSAQKSGSAIHSNDRRRIYFSCQSNPYHPQSDGFLTEDELINLKNVTHPPCKEWLQDSKSEENGIPAVSTYVSHINATVESNNTCSSIANLNNTLCLTVIPGDLISPIFLQSLDQYNQKNAKPYIESFRGSLGTTLGEFHTDLRDGNGTISGARDATKYKDFTDEAKADLVITFEGTHLNDWHIRMKIRNCSIGEERVDSVVLCSKCDINHYNFDPMNEHCHLCDESLDCTNEYVFPRDEYWHLTPCHTQAKKCLTQDACKSTEDILDHVKNGLVPTLVNEIDTLQCRFSQEAIDEYHRVQCKEGYEGVLCGSCKINYGRSLSFDCAKCAGIAMSVFIFVMACTFFVSIAVVTVVGNIPADEKFRNLQTKIRENALRNKKPIMKSLPPECTVDTEENVPQQNRELEITEIRTQSVTSNTVNHPDHDEPHTSVNISEAPSNSRKHLEDGQLAKWKLCEIFKVTVNFLQAITVAALTNVEWTTYMLRMFSIAAFVGGGSTVFTSLALQCLPWWPNPTSATIAGYFSNLIVPGVSICLIVTGFAILTLRKSKGAYYFIKRSLLGVLAVAYFSYLSITKIAVMSFYCVSVHTGAYNENKSLSSHWVLDTSLECYKGTHLCLVIGGGLLFVVFSVGFPVCSALLLHHFGNKNNGKGPRWMHDSMGFLYRAYDTQYVYWESVVMLRKAILSVIVVSSYHLGGDTQGLLASFVLCICLYLQTTWNPYRQEFKNINRYETLSLLISCTTFTLAQFFFKDRTVAGVKLALSLFLILLISTFFLYLVVGMVCGLVDVFKKDLIVAGYNHTDIDSSGRAVTLWLMCKTGTRNHLSSKGSERQNDQNGSNSPTEGDEREMHIFTP